MSETEAARLPVPTDPVAQPAKSAGRALSWVWLPVFTLLVLPFVLTSAYLEDEMSTLSSGLRIRQGEVLYRDFFEYATPLSHWLAGLALSAGGPPLLSVRLVQGFALVLTAGLCFVLTRRLGASRLAAGIPGLILVACLYRLWPGYGHHWLVPPLVLGALLAASQGMDTTRWQPWAVAGSLGGGAFLCLQSDGVVLAVALWGGLLLHGYGAAGLGPAWRRQGLALGMGYVAVLGICATILLSQGALGAAYRDAWLFIFSNYKAAGGINDIAYGSDFPAMIFPPTQLPFWFGRVYHFTVLYALGPVMSVWALVWGLSRLLRRSRAGERWDPDTSRLGLLALTAVGFTVLATRGRADYLHVAMYLLPAVLLATVLAERHRRATPLGRGRFAPVVVLVLYFLTGGAMQVKQMRQDPGTWLVPEGPDRRVAAMPVIQAVKALLRPGERLVAIPYGGLFYVYAGPPATRYNLIVPPSHGYISDAAYAEFWREVAVNRPQLIVLGSWLTQTDWQEFFARSLPPGYRLRDIMPNALTGGRSHAYLYERQGP